MSDLPSVPDLDFDVSSGIHDRSKADEAETAPVEEPPPPGDDVGGLADLLEPEESEPSGSEPDAPEPAIDVDSPEVAAAEPAAPASESAVSAPADGDTKTSTTKRRRSTKPRNPDDVKTRIMDHPTDGVPKVRSRDTLADSMDEVLQQASDHALRLVHVEDMITEMHEAVATLRHEILAREAAQDESGGAGGDAEAGHRMAARLDAVEMQSMRVESKASRLSLMSILQLLLLAGILTLLLMRGSEPTAVTQSVEPVVAEPPSTESGPGELIEPMPDRPEPEEEQKPTRKAKRKGKRRR